MVGNHARIYAKKIDGSRILWLYHQVLKLFLLRIVLAGLLIVSLHLIVSHDISVAALPEETIRVAIVKNVSTVTLDGEGILATRENGNAVALNPPVAISFAKNNLLVDGVTYKKLTLSSASAILVNGKPYRGIALQSVLQKTICLWMGLRTKS